MKTSRVILIAILVIAMVSSVSAFDGMRKGFVLGGGLGIAPVARHSAGDTEFDEVGAAANIFLGYAWNEYNMLVYESNAVAYKIDFGFFEQSIGQGLGCLSWYHYFGEQGKSFFTVVGIGFQYFKFEDLDANDAGGAYLLGAGYEFARHIQAVLYFSGGKTEFGSSDFGHNHLSLSVNAVAF